MKTAIYSVSKDGYKLAQKIRKNVYNDSHIYVSGRVYTILNLANEDTSQMKNVTEITTRIPEALNTTFSQYDVHIFIAATGAVVRMIEGKFKSKDTDPAVITIDDHANFVVSLLSGHLGGANEECRKIAQRCRRSCIEAWSRRGR